LHSLERMWREAKVRCTRLARVVWLAARSRRAKLKGQAVARTRLERLRSRVLEHILLPLKQGGRVTLQTAQTQHTLGGADRSS
jgi:hypothetical protein